MKGWTIAEISVQGGWLIAPGNKTPLPNFVKQLLLHY
jgi:hypothetical protein